VEDLESLTAFCEPLREQAAVVTRLALVEVDRYQFEVNGGLFPRAGEDVEERVAVLSTRNGDEDPVASLDEGVLTHGLEERAGEPVPELLGRLRGRRWEPVVEDRKGNHSGKHNGNPWRMKRFGWGFEGSFAGCAPPRALRHVIGSRQPPGWPGGPGHHIFRTH
jgi:hypothetical protein